MKSSIKGFFVILAIVMSFVLVQGVYAQRNIVLTTIIGYATEDTSAADKRTIGLDTNHSGYTDVTIYGMGPSWYWENQQVPYPEGGESLEILAYYCEILSDYVGVEVYYPDEDLLIKLRDSVTLKPLWNPNAKTTDLSDTAAEATGDGGPIKYDYDHNYDNDYDHNYGPLGPHGK